MSTETKQEADSGPPWTAPNGIYATYDLHCHCGTIRFTMTLSPPLYSEQTQGSAQCEAVECSCSFCLRNGLLAVHPLTKDVTFTQGLEERREYRCGTKKCPHWFCQKCGSVLGTDLRGMMEEMGCEGRYSINVRMLKAFDLARLKTRRVETMKTVGPAYDIDAL